MAKALSNLTDDELHLSAVEAARRDRAAELETLLHLREVERRKLFAQRGFSSLFSYTVEALGFSEPAAASRIQAMRLCSSVQGVEEKLASGALSVSSAARIQRFIKKEEKGSSRRLPPEEKLKLVEEVTGKSARQAERVLLSFSQAPEVHRYQESQRVVAPHRTELKLFASPELMEKIERVRELKGELSLEEIFGQALQTHLEKIDPTRKTLKARVKQATTTLKRDAEPQSQSQPQPQLHASSRYIPASALQALHQRSAGRCEFVDSQTGRRCEGRFRLQVEHQIPFALGGSNQIENLKHFCPQHNRWAAMRVFGEEKMRRYLKS